MSKSSRNVRAYDEDIIKLKELSFDISAVEKKDVKMPEVLRRTLRIPNLKNVLIADAEAKRNMRPNRRGMGGGIWALVVMVMIAIALMLIFFVISSVGPPITFLFHDIASGIITTTGNNTGGINGDMNLSNAISPTIGALDDTVQVTQWVGYMFVAFSIIIFIVFAFSVRSYPFLLPVWIVFILILAFVSLFITNSYGDISSGQSETYSTWANTDYIMNHLPMVITFMGIVGGIIMFTLIPRNSDAEEGIV